jgi:integrase
MRPGFARRPGCCDWHLSFAINCWKEAEIPPGSRGTCCWPSSSGSRKRAQSNGRGLDGVSPVRPQEAIPPILDLRKHNVLRQSQRIQSQATTWLRQQGIMTAKPLHTLRKEFGSVVASSGDIHQAQRQLRHAQISTTAKDSTLQVMPAPRRS